MSDLRVALIAEGPTDKVVIEAALKALLPRPFVLNLLQPEPTRPKMGTGWGGVLRWCLDFAKRGNAQLEDDPTLPGFDLFVLHADADVAERAYVDCGAELARLATERGWPVLPNRVPCPPASGSADVVRGCLLAWAGLGAPGPKTVLCVPSKAIDAWLVAAVLDDGHALLTDLECNLNVEPQLGALPRAQRIKKTRLEYLAREKAVTAGWPVVRQRCSQAERFSTEVAGVPV
ncbi:MAG: hypothetical protein R3B70_44080 [Polyangiaceae bacterium]